MERRKKEVKEDLFSITEFNARFEHKMREKIATLAKENNMKIDAIQEELRASNAKNNATLAMLNNLAGSMQVPPPTHFCSSWSMPHQELTPPPYLLHGPNCGVPSYPRTPHPTLVTTPLPNPMLTPHDLVSIAMHDGQDLQTRIHEF